MGMLCVSVNRGGIATAAIKARTVYRSVADIGREEDFLLKRRNITWLSPEEAIQMVEAAKTSGIALLGFDGAFLRDGATQPSLADSWDYSSRAYPTVPDPYVHAIQFIRERSTNGLHFEIVLAYPSLN